MKLHNVCVERRVPVPSRRHHEDCRSGDAWTVYSNHHNDDDILRARAVGNRRKNITDLLEAQGMARPPHALANSRAT